MTRYRPAFAVFLLAAPLPAQASGQPPAPAPAPAVRPWQVDWGPYFCALIRQPAEGRPYAAAFLTVPGDDATQLLLVPERGAALPRGIDSALLMPQGRSFPIRAAEQRRGAVQVLSIPGLPYELRGMLEGATELQLRAGPEVRARIPVDQSRAAIAAHRRCTAEIARQWRIDEAGLAALRARPGSTNRLGFRSSDYPDISVADRTQGRVILRITVTTGGRAADCSVVATSGDRYIDDRSCRVVMARARFTPALDAAGRPVAIASVFTVTWLVAGAR